MTDNLTLSKLLDELDAIANAPMTVSQREVRAASMFAEAAVTLEDVTRAVTRRSLPWNVRKAEEAGVSIELWLRAVRISFESPGNSLRDLLDHIHQAAAIAEMLSAGYQAGRDAYGNLVWSR
jgi:hypothetical protein